MKALLLVACLLLVSSQALTIGSCSKFSLDGQKCQACVEHFHLYEGSCYVDILGCQSYTFGNICHSCENGYILVNNLCCDHNCLAKLFKRHESTKVSKTITDNFQIFNKIIPFLNQRYIKGTLHNLVEIEEREYIDVRRFVLLYEFPSGKFRMRRAVVDWVKEGGEIVMVDWSRIQTVGELTDFHKDQVKVESDQEAGRVLEQAFKGKQTVSLMKKFKLTEIDQYEVVVQKIDTESILYQTFYLRDGRKLLLLNEQKSMPEFMPSEIRIDASEFDNESKTNPDLVDAIQVVKSDTRYRHSFRYVIIKHKNRYIKEYVFYIENDEEEIQFFLLQNIRTKSVKIIDYLRKQKEKLKPLVNNVVESIDTDAWKEKGKKIEEFKADPNLTPSENKVAELVHQAVKNIKEEKEEEKRFNECREVHCEDRDALTLPVEREQLEVVKLFRKRNPTITSFELIETWSHNFKTFTEWTILVRVTRQKKSTFHFFHALEFLETKEVKFWGQIDNAEPELGSDGKYALPNPQENVPESKVEAARAKINSQFPEVSSLQARKTILRDFPESRKRFVVVLRHKTSSVRYVVLNDETTIWIQESETIEQDLEPVTETIKNIVELEHKLDVVVDQVHHGKEVDPEVSLTKIKPIQVIEEVKEVKVVEQIENTHIKEKQETQVIKQIREKNEHLKDFEIIKTFKSETEQGQRETVLIKPIQETTTSTTETTETTTVEKTEPVYEYHTVIRNSQTQQITYVGHETKQAVLKDEKGKSVEPETLIKLAETKEKPQVEEKPIEYYVKNEIVQTLQIVKDVQEVSVRLPSKIEKFVYSQAPEMNDWELRQTWTNKDFRTYIEYALLFVKGQSYKYVYVFEWIEKDTYTLEGIETVEKPVVNEEGEFINPNPQHDYPIDNSTPLVDAITNEFPETRENGITKVIERIFPKVERYIVTLRIVTSKLRYVIHRRHRSIKIIEWDIIEKDLPAISKKTQVIKEIVEEAIKTVKEEKHEQKRLGECREVNCEERDVPSLPVETDQLEVVKLFRKRNPTITSFELIETWSHSFKTFTEWTILVLITRQKKSTFHFFHALEFLETKEVKFWGQVDDAQPELGSDGKYVLPNPQENVPESKVEAARAKINSQFPEVASLQARKTILRDFPESRKRFVIVLRHKTSSVRYVVLNDETTIWIQEHETIEQDLEPLTKEIQIETEFKNKLEVIVEQVEQKKNIDKQVDMKKITEEIQVTPIVHEEIVTVVKTVNEEYQTVKAVESPSQGKKTESTRTVSERERRIITRVIKLIKTKLTHHFSSHEFEIFENNEPLTIVEQRFCDHGDVVLIFDVSSTVYVLAFRESLAEEDGSFEYLGKFSFPRTADMTEQQIIELATAPRSDFDSASALGAITAKHADYSGLKPESEEARQLGDFHRITYLYKKDGFLNRFLIGGSPAGQYEIIEECRLEKLKEVFTETKVTVTGETELITNDIEKVVKEDKTAKEVIQSIKREVTQLKESTPVNVKVTEYDKKTEYVVQFETTTTTEQTEQVTTEEVSVVHDKVKHTNDIVAVQPVKPAEPVPEPVTEGQKPAPKPEEPTVPVVTEEKYVVITEKSPEVPKEVHEAIKQITEEVRVSEHIPVKHMEVKEVLVREQHEDSPVQKIQQVIENTKTQEQILVTAIVNTENNKVIIEDVKPVEQTVVKHLEPVEEPKREPERLEKVAAKKPKIVEQVNEEYQTVKAVESPSQGKKTESTRTISERERKIITRVTKLIKTKLTHHFSSHEIEIFESNEPLTIVEQRFCDHGDVVLIFDVSSTIYVLAFRESLAEEDGSFEYLGKFSFPRTADMTEQQIIELATAPRSDFDSTSALGAITAKHADYSGLKPESEEARQLGDFHRITYLFKKDGFLNRFLIGGSPAGQYEIIEECRLEKLKEVYTETKVTVTGETELITNDVEKIVKEDKTAKEVIQSIKREVTELKESTPVNVKVTDYDKKTEYVVQFETTTTTEQTEQVTTQEVSVVHDKVKHTNDIVAVQPVKPAEQVVEPVTEGQKPAPKPEEPTVPVVTEEKYVVVTEKSPEVPKEVHEAIKQITEEVRVSEHIPVKHMEVKEVLVREQHEDSPVQKIQQVIENTKTQEQILVTAIVNTENNKVIIEDVKPVEQTVVKHLEPVEEPKREPERLEKVAAKKPKIVEQVNEEYQTVKAVESPIQGKKTESTRTVSERERRIITRVTKLIKTKLTHHFSSHEIEIFENNEPLTIVEQRFCDHGDVVLIFDVSSTIYVLAFRESLAEEDGSFEYLGKFSFPRTADMTEQQIIELATAPRSDFDSTSALGAITAKHADYSGLKPESEEARQLGDFHRITYLYKKDGFLNRFLIGGSPAGQYEIIEECRLEKLKEVFTETKVTVTGETELITNDVEKVVKEDKTAKEVIQSIKREVTELKESTPVNVKVTDYDKKTEYIVQFETTTTTEQTEQVTTEEVSVVHDKVKHTNDIVAVQVIEEPVKPVPEPVTEGQKPAPKPEEPTVPVVTEEKYVVVTEKSPEVPKEVHEAIKQITEEVRVSEHIPVKHMEVKEVLVREQHEDSPVQKIQQVIENTKTQEQILVTAIVNTETNKVIIEDVKPVQEHIVKHLEPVQVTVYEEPILIAQPKPEPTKEQPVMVSPQEVEKVLIQVEQQIKKKETKKEVCEQISEYIKAKQAAPQSQEPTTAPQPEKQVVLIDPVDIHTVIQEIKQDISVVKAAPKQQIYTPTVVQTKQQILDYLQQAKPETSPAKVISTTTETLPSSIVTHIIQQTPTETIYSTVVKNTEGTTLTEYEKTDNENTATVQTIVEKIEKEDTASYQPVDPQISVISKAAQLVAAKPVTSEFERKVDLAKPNEKIEEVVQAVRNQYPITSTAPVIAATETKVSSTVSEIKLDFFVPETEEKTYKVDEAKIQINTASPEKSFTVTSFTEVVNNGVPTNVVLEKTNPTDVPNIINAAYGFEKLSMALAAKNPDIQAIEAEIQRRYPDFVSGETVSQIESLELKNGKVNYIFRYKTAYFTIYWDSLIKRIIFLNEVSSISRTEFTAIKDPEYYRQGLQYIVSLHPTEMKNYKTLSTGQSSNGASILFQIEFLSGNKKYRCIFEVHKDSMDIYELMFTELIEVMMRENSLRELKVLTEQYQRIDAGKYKGNRYLLMVDQFIKNRNQGVRNAKLLGVSYRPQNLGFSFRVIYKNDDSKLIEFEVYIETFSQKYSQTSLKLLNFDTDFSTAKAEAADVDKLLKAISAKTSLALIEGQYKLVNLEMKEFFFGCLFRALLTINGADYDALIYIDQVSGEINLISWKLRIAGDGCETKSADLAECVKCSNGFIASADGKSCLREITGCEVYGEDKLTCNVCKLGYEVINNICTKDCGTLCMAVAFP